MSIPLETLREMEALRQRVEELEYELGELRSKVDFEVANLMDFYDLTHNEARIVRALTLAHGAPLERSAICESMSGEIDYIRTVDSHIKRIRRKCAGRLAIHSLYGIGYRILQEDAKAVRAVMDGTVTADKPRLRGWPQTRIVNKVAA